MAEEKRGHRRGSRPAAGRRLRLFTVVALGAVALVLSVSTAPVESLLLRISLRGLAAAVGGTARASRLHVRPLRGEIEFEGFSLRLPADGSQLQVDIDSAKLSDFGFSRFTAELGNPRIDLVVGGGEEASGDPTAPAGWLDRVRLGKLVATGGSLRLRSADGPTILNFEQVDLQLERVADATFESSLAAGPGRIHLGDDEILFSGLESTAVLTQGGIDIADLRIEAEQVALQAKGTVAGLDSTEPIETTLELSARVSNLPTGGQPLTGVFVGTIRLVTYDGQSEVEASLQSAAVDWGALGPIGLIASGELANGIAEVSARATGYRGRLDLRATTPVSGGGGRADLHWADVDLDDLTRDLSGHQVSFGARLEGEADTDVRIAVLQSIRDRTMPRHLRDRAGLGS